MDLTDAFFDAFQWDSTIASGALNIEFWGSNSSLNLVTKKFTLNGIQALFNLKEYQSSFICGDGFYNPHNVISFLVPRAINTIEKIETNTKYSLRCNDGSLPFWGGIFCRIVDITKD